MNPTIFIFPDGIWLYSTELRPRWIWLSPEEFEDILRAMDILCDEWNRPMHVYDNFNVGMMALEERRFRSTAAYLERRGP